MQSRLEKLLPVILAPQDHASSAPTEEEKEFKEVTNRSMKKGKRKGYIQEKGGKVQ